MAREESRSDKETVLSLINCCWDRCAAGKLVCDGPSHSQLYHGGERWSPPDLLHKQESATVYFNSRT